MTEHDPNLYILQHQRILEKEKEIHLQVSSIDVLFNI